MEGGRDGSVEITQLRSHHIGHMVRTAHYRMNGAETFTIFVTTDNSFIVTS